MKLDLECPSRLLPQLAEIMQKSQWTPGSWEYLTEQHAAIQTLTGGVSAKDILRDFITAYDDVRRGLRDVATLEHIFDQARRFVNI